MEENRNRKLEFQEGKKNLIEAEELLSTKCESENIGNIFQRETMSKWEKRTEMNNMLDRTRPDSKKVKMVKARHSVSPLLRVRQENPEFKVSLC